MRHTVFKATRIPFPGKPPRPRIQLTDRDYHITTQVEADWFRTLMESGEQTALFWGTLEDDGRLRIGPRAEVQDWYRMGDQLIGMD